MNEYHFILWPALESLPKELAPRNVQASVPSKKLSRTSSLPPLEPPPSPEQDQAHALSHHPPMAVSWFMPHTVFLSVEIPKALLEKQAEEGNLQGSGSRGKP